MQAIRTENLHKEYKDVAAVKSLNLAVEEGELFSLLGVNGAGKTTTIKMLSCLTKPTSGDAFLMGKSIFRDAAEVKSVIGVSPQETAVAPNLTVEENLKLMCGIHSFDKAKTGTKVTELAARFGLDSVMHKKAGKLSGGWQRRLSIAMALISEPKILFLDEPTLGLDVLARSELWDSIRELKGKVTVILTTHYMEEAEELFSLLGVNGAGKTTTIKMLSCLTKPTSGDAFLMGKSIFRDAAEVKSVIGVSPQETAVAPNLTVEENLKLMCGIHSFDKAKTGTKVTELAARFGLDSVMHKKAGKLSGGWQRRLSIAMALISEPKILFLDEPTLGLDVLARSELWDSIRELKGKVTVILTTHYMEEAEELSDRIGIMKDGCLLTVGSAEEIKKSTGKDRLEDAFIAIVKVERK